MTVENVVGKMRLLKTSEQLSTDSVSSDPENQKTSRGRKTFRTITTEHVHEAMAGYLRSMSLIDDDEAVIHFFKTPQGMDVKIGKV